MLVTSSPELRREPRRISARSAHRRKMQEQAPVELLTPRVASHRTSMHHDAYLAPASPPSGHRLVIMSPILTASPTVDWDVESVNTPRVESPESSDSEPAGADESFDSARRRRDGLRAAEKSAAHVDVQGLGRANAPTEWRDVRDDDDDHRATPAREPAGLFAALDFDEPPAPAPLAPPRTPASPTVIEIGVGTPTNPTRKMASPTIVEIGVGTPTEPPQTPFSPTVVEIGVGTPTEPTWTPAIFFDDGDGDDDQYTDYCFQNPAARPRIVVDDGDGDADLASCTSSFLPSFFYAARPPKDASKHQ
ncbi:hypothetical protein M885DRAFT_516074 [Pelagophyceae sp. CCMP2097]|nr:hypothetical protein M885DRAFT_516074 [Pelagophyceae sp. CCMP2097]